MRDDFWTEEEDEYLKENYNKIPYEEMEKHLDRTYNAICARAQILKPYPHPDNIFQGPPEFERPFKIDTDELCDRISHMEYELCNLTGSFKHDMHECDSDIFEYEERVQNMKEEYDRRIDYQWQNNWPGE